MHHNDIPRDPAGLHGADRKHTPGKTGRPSPIPLSPSPPLPVRHHSDQALTPLSNRETVVRHKSNPGRPHLSTLSSRSRPLGPQPGDKTPDFHGKRPGHQLVAHIRCYLEWDGVLCRAPMVTLTWHGALHGCLLRSGLRSLLERPPAVRHHSIQWKELYAIVMACEVLRGLGIIHCDNMAVVQLWHQGYLRHRSACILSGLCFLLLPLITFMSQSPTLPGLTIQLLTHSLAFRCRVTRRQCRTHPHTSPADAALVSMMSQLIESVVAPSTRRVYAAGVRQFQAFCASHGTSYLPASELSIILFCTAQSARVHYHLNLCLGNSYNVPPPERAARPGTSLGPPAPRNSSVSRSPETSEAHHSEHGCMSQDGPQSQEHKTRSKQPFIGRLSRWLSMCSCESANT